MNAQKAQTLMELVDRQKVPVKSDNLAENVPMLVKVTCRTKNVSIYNPAGLIERMGHLK